MWKIWGAVVAMGLRTPEVTLNGPHVGCMSGAVAQAEVMRLNAMVQDLVTVAQLRFPLYSERDEVSNADKTVATEKQLEQEKNHQQIRARTINRVCLLRQKKRRIRSSSVTAGSSTEDR
ncbi:unnamed protein product [Musa acuminata subsp. malaccensis]|uniref:(wild Malaysian banana) hypothetical protein n=1 Tax=Musa acuminata subsp. malaccensis TaxID=214687 RepID=A0A804KBN2_MUSAM|nr:unnamed protein product [Musa acuminata subsp. malaccensis]